MSTDDVAAWLTRLDLARYARAFTEAEVDVSVLPHLTDADLREMGLPVGPRRKILNAIAGQRARVASSEPARATISGGAERRQVTVVFYDLVGSTELSTNVDAEDLREVIRAYQDCCGTVIARYGGFVARYMGDGILVYFGYPQAHEYDAERAVRASLEVVTAVGTLDVLPGQRLRTRIGIATGEVVVGDLIGEGPSLEQAVVGETPNLAARLQSLAEPDSIVVAESTRQLLGSLFDLADNGERRLKGFSQPVRSWVVLGERAVDSRFEATHDGRGMSPLVGRAHEREMLHGEWQRASAGRGRTMLVLGEAGIGKSRMIEDFLDGLAAETHELLRFFGSPYHQHSALYPVISRIERRAEFARTDTPAQRLDKLEALLSAAGVAPERYAALFAALLSLPTEHRYPPLSLSPSRQKVETLDAILDVMLALSRRRPLVVVFEDLHWADPTTLDLVDRIASETASAPTLLLLTARPEFTPAPAIAGAVVMLTRLDNADVAAIVRAQTGGKTLPAPVLAQILEHTDGVPLFVEEITKTVLEEGFLRDAGDRYVLDGPMPALAVPSTLQESLTARLDRLMPVKEVAQIGALIGRRFSYELLSKVSSFSDGDLSSALERLVQAGLVFGRGLPPDAVYTFKHALVQDAAHSSLLRNRRQSLHRRIAEVLEADFPETLESEPELLAHHFGGAGMVSRAVEYWHRAGQRAIERSAHVEAADHLRRGIELLHTLPHDTARDERELALQAALAPALLVGEGYGSPRVGATFARVRQLGHESGDVERVFLALRGEWAFHFVRAEYARARELAVQLRALALEQDSAAMHLETYRAFGMTDLYVGRFASALEHLDAGLARYDRDLHGEHARRYGNDPGVVCLCYGALALWFLGRADSALERVSRALALADDLGQPFTRVQARAIATMVHQKRIEPAATRRRADEALELAIAQGGFPYWESLVSVLRGWAVASDGDHAAGVAEMRRGLGGYTATGAVIARPWFLGLLAQALHGDGDDEAARASLAEALELAAGNGEGYWRGELERLAAGLEGESLAERAERLEQALGLVREQGAMGLERRVLHDLVACRAELGDTGAARALLDSLDEQAGEHRDGADAKALIELRQRLA